MCPEAFGIFDHLIGRDGIESSLLVAGRVVEHEEALGKAIDLALKDVDRAIDLGDEFLRIEVPIAILPWFEHDVGLCCHRAGVPTLLSRNPRP